MTSEKTKEKSSESRKKRSEEIARIKQVFSEVEGGVLTDYRGLKVSEITDLRRRFRAESVDYQVIKNSLTRLALKGSDYEDLDQILSGPTGIAFGRGDPIAAARVAVEFSKDHEALEVKGGFMDGEILSTAQVAEVSTLTGKKELKASFLAVLNGPAQKLLGVLTGVPRKFLGVLDAQADKLEGS
ncbi:MAG TPA: 50S ribosomal protein L10 [Myxococcota bacterium]|nr:50S ribosomal protein L10 [Myxococcota bacterium]